MTYVTPIFLYNDTMLHCHIRIESYVNHHPRSTRTDIAKALEMLPAHVSSYLNTLMRRGKVRRVRSRGDAGVWVWEPGQAEDWEPPEPKIAIGEPKQTTVSTWEPERRRDELTAALFGNANVDRRKNEQQQGEV